MKIRVLYHSSTGNTKKVAEAIATAAKVQAEAIAEDTMLSEPVDLLFLGAAPYAGNVNRALPQFIESLSPDMVGRVAVFGTAASPNSTWPQLKGFLDARRIPVLDQYFHCRGQFLLAHRGRPNAQDLQKAVAFTQEIIEACAAQ